MGLFFFLKGHTPRKFEHKPIYWDPRKEALEERIAKVKKEMGIETGETEFKPNIKGTFVNAHTHLKRRLNKGEDSEKRNARNIILAVVLVLLIIVFYYFYF